MIMRSDQPRPANQVDIRPSEWAEADRRYNLTPAEGQVLRAVFHGRTMSQTAESMGISRSGVQQHWMSVKVKLGIADHPGRDPQIGAIKAIFRVVFEMRGLGPI